MAALPCSVLSLAIEGATLPQEMTAEWTGVVGEEGDEGCAEGEEGEVAWLDKDKLSGACWTLLLLLLLSPS